MLLESIGDRQRLGRRAAAARARVDDDRQVRRGGSDGASRDGVEERQRALEHARRSAARARQARAGRERVRARGGRARVGQPDGVAQSRGAALRSRRARQGDEGVRSLHRRLQRGGRRESHERRARRRGDGRRVPRHQRSAAVQGCASRRSTARLSTDPLNADAKVKLGELFLRKYNFADAQNDVRGSACRPIRTTRARCSARRCVSRRTGRAATRCCARRSP